MSKIQFIVFFRFCRVEVMDQYFDTSKNTVHVQLKPDERFTPICSKCKQKAPDIHSSHKRSVSDLSILGAETVISIIYRRVRCTQCGAIVEALPLIDPYKRVTRRPACYILQLCQYMTNKEVAQHLEYFSLIIKDAFLNST
jgi:transposase